MLWIFTDWDETITAHDTLALIAPPDSSEPNAPPPFSYFADYYMKIIRDYEDSYGPRKTVEQQLEYLASLGPVERKSVKKIEEGGLFKGVTREYICKRAQQVEFRKGWKDFTEQAMKRDHIQLKGILSVNWSRLFIGCALRRIHDDEFIKQFEIHANEVEMDSQGIGTGIISKAGEDGICTGHDKLREMKKAMVRNPPSQSIITVYVGDSDTDLPCLLEVDIGIIIGNNSSLRETCERVGIDVVHGKRWQSAYVENREKQNVALYKFDDWHDIVNSGLLG